MPQLSRELKSCEARGAQEFCQKPVVTLGHTPNYPVLPRYVKVLATLGRGMRRGSARSPLMLCLPPPICWKLRAGARRLRASSNAAIW